MKTFRRRVRSVASTLLFVACIACAFASSVAAQTPAPDDGGTDVFGNMPGATILLVPIVLGGAYYVSRRLGPRDDGSTTRREGAVSRTLARTKKR
jgi:hypothetical protein